MFSQLTSRSFERIMLALALVVVAGPIVWVAAVSLLHGVAMMVTIVAYAVVCVAAVSTAATMHHAVTR